MKKLPVPIRIVKIKSPLVLVCSMLLAISTFFNSCKKEGFPEAETVTANAQVTQRFLLVPPGTDPIVSRIIAEINNRNNKKEFITGFAAKNGYPVWDKVLAVNSRNKNASNIVGNTPSDTIIYIPLVLPDSFNVNGFIRATVNDSIALNYSLSMDYKVYPEDENSSWMTSDEFTLLIMKLNKTAFGYKQFVVTDSSLFNSTAGNISNNQTTQKTIRFVDSASSFAGLGGSASNLSIEIRCEDIIVSICPTVPAFSKQDNTSWTTGTRGVRGWL